MADRSIAVKLRLDVNDFTKNAALASKGLDDIASKMDKSAAVSNTTMGKLTHSARENAAAWTSVGGALAGAGAAVTGFNALVAKTGIEYNTLQQKSRAALTTILGGSKEANAQMDKLDEFARTSPFSKAVFIQAQQQMLGFGIEAKKVIPYLSAINETIAATGGNNNDLAEIVRIFSQISAAGKITATDLMQFGQRGVDAATLIGSQMGYTGAEIRDQITKGTLDAGKALDALADGMQSRFEGASAGVKNTMEGAFDRVKAAWRDLSASFMEGAVGQNGGGWLVDMTNGLADMLRAIDKLPQPTKDAVGAISAVTGAAALAGGAALMAVPKFVELHSSLDKLREVSPRTASALGKVGKAAGVAIAAFAAIETMEAFKASLIGAGQTAEETAVTLSRVAKGITDVDAAFQKADGSALRSGGLSLSQGWIGDLNTLENATKGFLSRVDYADKENGKLFGLISTGATDAVEAFRSVDAQLKSMTGADATKVFSEMEARMRAAGATSQDIIKAFPQLSNAARKALTDASNEWQTYSAGPEDVLRVMRGDLPRGLVMTEQGIMAVSEAAAAGAKENDNLTESTENTAAAAEKAAAAHAEYMGELAAGSARFIDIVGAYDTVIQKNRDLAQSEADKTKSSKDSWEDFIDNHKFTLDAYLAQLEEQAAAQAAWEANMLTLAGRASQGLIDHLAKMGPEAAPLVAELVDATDEELARMEAVFAEGGTDSAGAFAEALVEAPAVWAALAQVAGQSAVDSAAAEVAAGKATLQDIIRRYDLTATINANADPAISAARNALARIENMTATMDVTARIRAYNANGLNAPVWTGGRVGDVAAAYGLAAGGSPRWVGQSGRVFGPGTGTSDSVDARISRDEFVTRERAARYYGYDLLYAMNAMAIPRERFAQLGFADGGTPRAVSPMSRAMSGVTPLWHSSGPGRSIVPAPAGDSLVVQAYGADAGEVTAKVVGIWDHRQRVRRPRR